MTHHEHRGVSRRRWCEGTIGAARMAGLSAATTIATGGQAAGEASNTSSTADRNCASFHERFRDTARLSFGPLTVLLEQTDGEQRVGETMQSTVWTAGCALAGAMQAGIVPCAGASVIELGSGTGLCGIVAAACGARDVTLTDLPPLLPLLARNAATNGVDCSVRALDWCADERALDLAVNSVPPPDLILGSDITCFIQDLPQLSRLLERLARPSDAAIVLAHHERGGDSEHVLDAFDACFRCERIHAGANPHKDVSLFSLRVREREGADPFSHERVHGDAAHAAREPSGVECDAEESSMSTAIEAACRGDVRALKQLLR